MEEVIFLADLHIPYEDKKAVNKALDIVKQKKPKIVILGGDILDFYQVSRFDKNPERIGKLQEEFNKYYKFMDKLRGIFKGKLIYLIGNHEFRQNKYLKRNPELYGLDFLKLDYILKKDKYNFELLYEYTYKGVLFMHGTKVNKYNASGELTKNNVTGISGHKHNYNVASNTTRRGRDVWISAPCLCDINQQGYVHHPNWQVGLLVLKFDNKRMISQEVVFLD